MAMSVLTKHDYTATLPAKADATQIPAALNKAFNLLHGMVTRPLLSIISFVFLPGSRVLFMIGFPGDNQYLDWKNVRPAKREHLSF